ncbi:MULTISPECIES: ParB/RepB/Spo0J family partition protein [unclassified Rhizobium]|jgi:ParB family chromosome partitioning protein|uniref:ParB/RepB/Spo0J family partition protein n=1 Tax=unclassified Rhizobium TaxID=2613769 RepID=UPI000649253E|nr:MULTISPECIES: ParB/RepB/Spo0J family partition protein [unclassified Rhizobium]TXI01825.1 MAG: ParB/RepB/Spo0J family partition protein [Rhizobium sp.]NKJ08501.1 ParB family chromosome partitioning protein [Rhizobium sp. SG741]OCJ08230.1 DNA-binding protein [Rhizobium sp. AC27/96]RKD50449.1 ParB family chromosome partitioning protein [Rhizobium sp. WW_1]TIX93314.1 ParB/RepB/Spo0J family partition protein [Rhizobium sp. P44RR-XXIV]
MAQAMEKITLSAARDIPFNKLVLSQQNVRKIKVGVSIEDLAEDIAHRGLLTSLNVRPELDGDGNETGIYRIPAGGRRYRALERLVVQKRLAKTAGVPCIVSKGETLEVEDSLAENVQRVSLHPLDQFRAFQTLREQGLGEEEIASRFFVSVATVKQRLRLASVSTRLLDLYADDEMTLEQIMAFSIANDHVRQEQVWDTISRSHSREPYYIRRLLTETAIRASDRRAVYVGTESYEAAGGVTMRDLFDQDQGGWLQDPALLEQLVMDKLKADAEAIRVNEGWKWVEAAFDFPYGHTSGLRRFYGEQAEMTEDELARFDATRAEYDKLDAEYAEADEYSEATEQKLEELGAELDRLNDRPYVFDPQEVARGGVFVSLGAGGELKIERGFVRPVDEPQAVGSSTEDVGGDITDHGSDPSSPSGDGVQADDEDETLKPLPDRLVLDLTAARTVALRNALANNPVIAFIAVLHAFVLKIFYVYGSDSCVEVTLQSARFSQTPGLGNTVWAKEIEQRHEGWGQDLPKDPNDLWEFLIKLDEVSRQALFGHCASLSVNAVIEPWNKRTRAIAHADQLARSIGFDMVGAGWTPTADNYLGRVTKARILQAVREAKGDQAAELIGHLKKTDMAREAERLMTGCGWLPEPLRMTIGEGTIESDAVADSAVQPEVVEPVFEASDLPAFLLDEPGTSNDNAGDTENEIDGGHLAAAE